MPVDRGTPQLFLNRGPNSAQIVFVGKSRLQVGAGWSFYADNTRPERLVMTPRARSMVYSAMVVVTYCAMSVRHVWGMRDREVDSGLTSNCCAHAEQYPPQIESQGPYCDLVHRRPHGQSAAKHILRELTVFRSPCFVQLELEIDVT